MTDATMTLAPTPRPWAGLARITPAGGWLTLGLVLVMAVTVALSIDDARIILGRGELTDLLMWTAIGGVLFGTFGPTIGWRRWTTYAIGSIVAALIVPLMVGAGLPDVAANPTAWFEASGKATWEAVGDLLIRNQSTTNEVGHHMVVLGLWVWASSMFAAYAVFGHRRPLNAVLLLGVLLVFNVGFTSNDQLIHVVVFSLGALFLLIRSHAFEERADWLRRRIGDPSAIAALYLRGGTIFISVAVIGALLLTTVAQSAPLAGVWTDVGAQVIDWSRGLARFVPRSGTGPAFAPDIGSSAVVPSNWVTNQSPAFLVRLDPSTIAYEPLWRARTYDVMTRDGWDSSTELEIETPREAGATLLESTVDQASEEGTTSFAFTIEPAQPLDEVFSPATPSTVSVPIREVTIGTSGFYAAMERDLTRDAYTAVARIPAVGDDTPGGLTGNRLRAAPSEYPEEVAALYAQPIDRSIGLLGPGFDRVRAEIAAEAEALGDQSTAYDYAKRVVVHLQDQRNFTYDPTLDDNEPRCASDLSYLECFAQEQHGFCQHYAGLMVALMREEGYAARIAQGFRSGQADRIRFTRTVNNDDLHAWVEVFFPGYGWVTFDPTGGSIGTPPTLPDGEDQAGVTPRPSRSASPVTRSEAPERSEPPFNPGNLGGGGIVGPFIVVTLLLALVVGLLAAVAWRRGPRGPVTADGAYGMVTRLASRLGFAPLPNQTVFEYTGALAEILPDARPQLETVAAAKVEVAYGGRRLGVDRLQGLRDAQRRLRTSLLRLALRRDRRRRR